MSRQEFLRKLRVHKLFWEGPLAVFLRKLKSILTPEAEAPAEPPLALNCESDLENFGNRLLRLDGMLSAARDLPNGATYCKELDNIGARLKTLLENKKLLALDEESGEALAEQLIRIFPRFGNLLRPCLERPDSQPHIRLAAEIEKYLATIGISRLEMREGAPALEWLNLNMENDLVEETSEDPFRIGTIAKIILQPRSIRFVDAYGDIEERYFGGRCVIYKGNKK